MMKVVLRQIFSSSRSRIQIFDTKSPWRGQKRVSQGLLFNPKIVGFGLFLGGLAHDWMFDQIMDFVCKFYSQQINFISARY